MPKMWVPSWFVAAKNPSLLCRIRSSFWAVKGSELSQQPWAMILMPFEFLGCNVFKKVEKLPDLPFQLKWTWSAMMSPRFYDFGRWLEKLGLHSGVVSFGLSLDCLLTLFWLHPVIWSSTAPLPSQWLCTQCTILFYLHNLLLESLCLLYYFQLSFTQGAVHKLWFRFIICRPWG